MAVTDHDRGHGHRKAALLSSGLCWAFPGAVGAKKHPVFEGTDQDTIACHELWRHQRRCSRGECAVPIARQHGGSTRGAQQDEVSSSPASPKENDSEQEISVLVLVGSVPLRVGLCGFSML